MTGYGRAKRHYPKQTLSLELKSLNSKSLDLRLRLPAAYQSKEIELRRLLSQRLIHGKVDLTLQANQETTSHVQINRAVFEAYFYQLLAIAGDNGIEHGDILYTVSRMPNVVEQHEAEASDEEWAQVLETLEEALVAFTHFRAQEGETIRTDMQMRVELILSLLNQVMPLEAERVQRVRQRILQQVERVDLKLDANRLEQEMIFYLEKYDISEEKQRLQQHCSYFLQELASEAQSKGAKLGFVAQEMGREINTLGSKANDAEIQKLVIQMKDELEKIKEQLANVL